MTPSEQSDAHCKTGPHPSEVTSTPNNSTALFHRRITWLGATLLIVTIFSMYLHVVRFQHAGGLWRDEVNSVQTATSPTWERFQDIWRFDSFPMTWFGVLRAWCAIPGGDTDTGLRLLGLLTGLAVIVVMWLNAHWMGYRMPVFSISLVALNPIVIIYGDSVRAYGLGMVLEILMFGLLWRLGQCATRGRFFAATLVAILTVHCLYNHSLTLFAMAVGIMAACAIRRDWKNIAALLLVGIIAAVTVIPLQANITEVNEFWVIIKSGFSWSSFQSVIIETIQSQHGWMVWIWTSLFLAAVIVCVLRLRKPRDARDAEQNQVAELCIAGLTTSLIYVLITFAFLVRMQMPTHTWYYINILAVLGICLDMMLATPRDSRLPAGMKTALVAIVVIISSASVTKAIRMQMTNINVVAQQLKEHCGEHDYVVIVPYYISVSFNRYNETAAAWQTLPPVADPTVHRMDEIKQQLAEREPLQEIFAKTKETLRQGNRVWTVRIKGYPIWPPNVPPVQLPPAPDSPYGWNSGIYLQAWRSQLDAFLWQNAISIADLPLQNTGAVSKLETVYLNVASGLKTRHQNTEGSPTK